VKARFLILAALLPLPLLGQISQPAVVQTATTPATCSNFFWALTTTSPWTIYAPTASSACQALGTGTVTVPVPVADGGTGGATAQAGLNNLYASAGGIELCPGVVNDACPNTGGTSSHMVCSGSGTAQTCTCTSGTGPTDNYSAIQACLNSPGRWLLPASSQGSQGWIYEGTTPVISATGVDVEGVVGGIQIGGSPAPSSTVIETQSSANIPALEINGAGTQVLGTTIANLGLVAVNTNGAVDSTVGSAASALSMPAFSSPSAYTGYNTTIKNVSTSGYGAGGVASIDIYGAARSTIDEVLTQQLNLSTAGPGLELEGPGVESNWFRYFRSVGGANTTACGLQLGGSSVYTIASSYFDNMDTSYGVPVCFGSSTQLAIGWFRLGEYEATASPLIVGPNSSMILQTAGTESSSLANGSLVKTGANSTVLVESPQPSPSITNAATETITAGTPTPTTGTGSLAAGTYYYELTGVNPGFVCSSSTTNSTLVSNEVSATLSATGEISVPFTLASTVNGYPAVALFRGTSSGGETCLHVFPDVTASVLDNGSYGSPSGAVPSTSSYYHPAIDNGTNGISFWVSPPLYGQVQNTPSNAQKGGLTERLGNGEVVYSNPFATYVTAGLPTAAWWMRGEEFLYFPQTSTAVSDSGPEWVYKTAAGAYAYTPSLANPSGSGSVVLANNPTVVGLTDTGTTNLANVNIANCISGCSGVSTFKLAGPIINTGSTSSTQVGYITIPAGTMDATGQLIIHARMDACTASGVPFAGCTAANTGTCTMLIRFSSASGSNGILIATGAASAIGKGGNIDALLQNLTTSTQETASAIRYVSGSTTITTDQASVATSVNTTSASYIQVDLINTVSADGCVLVGANAQYVP
jgi:hypothetical protein